MAAVCLVSVICNIFLFATRHSTERAVDGSETYKTENTLVSENRESLPEKTELVKDTKGPNNEEKKETVAEETPEKLYAKAVDLRKSGDFEAAAIIFESLGDYGDSQHLAEDSREFLKAIADIQKDTVYAEMLGEYIKEEDWDNLSYLSFRASALSASKSRLPLNGGLASTKVYFSTSVFCSDKLSL